MTAATRACQECGNPITSHRSEAMFCCAPCRQRFNNRRMQRGAELYDLFRAMRRERADAKEFEVWTMMCRLEKKWSDEDEGRKTWVSPKRALRNLVDKGSIPRGEILCRPHLGSKPN